MTLGDAAHSSRAGTLSHAVLRRLSTDPTENYERDKTADPNRKTPERDRSRQICGFFVDARALRNVRGARTDWNKASVVPT